jgi:hypothetical protein
VSLSGGTALIGAPYHDVDGKVWQGAAYVFVANRPGWMYQAELTGAEGVAGDQFGASVSLSGSTALVGARNHRPGADPPNAGAAYVFVRALGPTGAPAWRQQAELTAADGEAGDLFGTSVAVESDAALVGAPDASAAGRHGVGAAYVFARSGASWTQQAKLTASDSLVSSQVKIGFGSSVALFGDAAVVGAPGHDRANRKDSGAAYTFARSGTMWVQQQLLTAADGGPLDALGTSVALSGDTSLVGAPKHRLDGEMRGAAYVFPATPSIKTFKPAYGPVGTSVSITGSFFGDVTGVAFNGTAASYIAFGTAISATVPPGAQTGPITLTFPSGSYVSGDPFLVTTGLIPAIGKLEPAYAKPGRLVTISGANFGSKWRRGCSVKFGSKKAIVSSWGANEIKCKVPLRTGWGAMLVTVTTLRGTSNGMSFTVNH